MADDRSPKHGSSPKTFPDRDEQNPPKDHISESQPDGTGAEAPRGETQAQPNPEKKRVQPTGVGPSGDHSAAGSGARRVNSDTPENRTGQINPSAPTDATESATTRTSDAEKQMPPNPNMDSAGEIGEPSGKGTIDLDPKIFEGANSGHDANGKRDNKHSKGKREDAA